MRRAGASAGWSCAIVIACVAGCVPDVPLSGAGGSGTTTSTGGGDGCWIVAGHQDTGTSPPVVAGPVSGAVRAGASLTVTGVSITDAQAATNQGAMVVKVSVSAGTVAMTVDGGLVDGSGTSQVTYSSSLAAINAALAGLTYTAPGAATSDVLEIKPTDQFGASNALLVPITVLSGATCGH